MMEEAHFGRKVAPLEAFILSVFWCCDTRQVTPFGSRDSLRSASEPFAEKADLSPTHFTYLRTDYSSADVLDEEKIYCA